MFASGMSGSALLFFRLVPQCQVFALQCRSDARLD